MTGSIHTYAWMQHMKWLMKRILLQFQLSNIFNENKSKSGEWRSIHFHPIIYEHPTIPQDPLNQCPRLFSILLLEILRNSVFPINSLSGTFHSRFDSWSYCLQNGALSECHGNLYTALHIRGYFVGLQYNFFMPSLEPRGVCSVETQNHSLWWFSKRLAGETRLGTSGWTLKAISYALYVQGIQRSAGARRLHLANHFSHTVVVFFFNLVRLYRY
jgi:hypothetical protein